MKVSIHEPILLLQLLLAFGRRAHGVRVRGVRDDGVAPPPVDVDDDAADDAARRRGLRVRSRAPPPVEVVAPSRLLRQVDGDGHSDLHERADADVASGHRLSSDVFEGDIVVTYDDVAVNYGAGLAERLADDGFVFADDPPPPVGGGGGAAPDGRLRGLGLTSEAYRTWNLPEYRLPDGRLRIPYDVNASSYHLGGETLDTIHLALETIANSSGVVTFAPRLPTDASYISFVHLPDACAANLGRNPRGPTHVYLGWCTSAEHRGEMVHEILHALGFWHEQSRPDRDEHVTILTENVQPYAINNFAKLDRAVVNSLGSPYDYGSIMHYPDWAFQKRAGLATIAPARALERWEVMGQCGRMSPSDVMQLRLMYQCGGGSRDLSSITPDSLCTASCKCWAYAFGSCRTDDDCMGDLTCGAPPAVIPGGEEYYDQLPRHTSSSAPPACQASCHANCCHLARNVAMCPETCDAAPPEVVRGPPPRRMCVEATTTPAVPTAPPTEAPTGAVRARPNAN
jgi:hypothetical protein